MHCGCLHPIISRLKKGHLWFFQITSWYLEVPAACRVFPVKMVSLFPVSSPAYPVEKVFPFRRPAMTAVLICDPHSIYSTSSFKFRIFLGGIFSSFRPPHSAGNNFTYLSVHLTSPIRLLPSDSSHLTPPIWLLPSDSSHPTPPIRLLPSDSSDLTPPIRLLPSYSSHLTPPIWLIPSDSCHRTPPIRLPPSDTSHPTTHPTPPIWLLPSDSSHLSPPIWLLPFDSKYAQFYFETVMFITNTLIAIIALCSNDRNDLSWVALMISQKPNYFLSCRLHPKNRLLSDAWHPECPTKELRLSYCSTIPWWV